MNLTYPIDAIKGTFFSDFDIELFIARLDLIHPIVSGNKLFKLHYFIESCKQQSKNKIITFGGAYSNHLAATAFYAKEMGITSVGLVRGEESIELSHTLKQCKEYGMELEFLPRESYKKQTDPFSNLINEFTDHEEAIIIPEGGYHPLGALGASLIMHPIKEMKADYVCTAVGTATTLAGLSMQASTQQHIIAIPVLKNLNDLNDRLTYLSNGVEYQQPVIFNDYHFGGYAKKTESLLTFMNDIYKQYQIPTDFVYTGKMLFGVFDLIQKGFFKKGSKIICIHTGGLQGNLSLDTKTLLF